MIQLMELKLQEAEAEVARLREIWDKRDEFQINRIRELEAEVARLNGEIAEWSKASFAVVQRCSRAEDEVARLREQRHREYRAMLHANSEMQAEVARMRDRDDQHWAIYENEGRLQDRVKELETEIERLNGQIAEWSKANLEIVARCSAEEKRAAELAKEVERLEQYVPSRFVANDPRREKKKG